ncbi:MAG: class I SAM-dependent methyltransferase [Rhodothermales bacterium]|nr:class I SAM-dependent methyltransferase [Rhodothermales bacterium]
MTWYEQWFSRDEYDVVYSNRNDEEAVALINLVEQTLATRQGTSILDVGCGRGRHAIEFARRGYDVTGLDLSSRAIEIAKEKAKEAGVTVTFLQGDMRIPVDKQRFDGVVNLFTAFGYFEDWSDHQKAVDAMVAAVKPGGFVVQDFLNPSYVAMELIPEDERTVGDTLISQRRWIDEGRILKEIVFSSGKESHTFFESVALLEQSDFNTLYKQAGLDLDCVMGDYSGAPYSETSPRMILFSRRAD